MVHGRSVPQTGHLGSMTRTVGWSTPQLAWSYFPTWFKSNCTETVPHDWIGGDVTTHTYGSNNDAAQGIIVWTSPINGVVTVTGNLWWGGVPDQFFWANDWYVQLNGVSLTGGVGAPGSGCGYDRSHPIDFRDGFGGPHALDHVIGPRW